jgi:hypothetical protein
LKTRKIVPGAIFVVAVAVSLTAFAAPSWGAPSREINVGGTNTIGFEFEHTNYGGEVLTVFGGAYCTGTTNDVDFQTTDLPYGGGWPLRWWWDNTISSFKNEDACYTKHYTDENYDGAADPSYSNDRTSMVNGMNDVTNSIRWS